MNVLYAVGNSRKLSDFNDFNDFWLGMVKNRHDYLVHEAPKSAECAYELS